MTPFLSKSISSFPPQLYLFLFNDILVLCEPKKYSQTQEKLMFDYISTLSLKDIKVKEVKSDKDTKVICISIIIIHQYPSLKFSFSLVYWFIDNDRIPLVHSI